jgi:hypothetical protein
MMETSAKQVLVILGPGCSRCHSPHKHTLVIETIEDHEKRGWKPRGTRRTTERSRCPTCAAMFESARSAISIECPDALCATCGATHEYAFTVEQIDARGREFSFQASVHCNACDTTKRLAEVIDDPLKVKRLEVKVNGIVSER